MSDYKELIKQLILDYDCCELTNRAADAIEELLADNESYKCALADLYNEIANYCETIDTLEKERDAAVADLKSVLASECVLNQCRYCKHQEDDYQCHHDCIPCYEKCGWEWRGVQDE